jgi:chromosome segregation ATPase
MIRSTVQETINQLSQQVASLNQQNLDLNNTITQMQAELISADDHSEKTSRELERLRARFRETQEEVGQELLEKDNVIQDLQSRLQREERDREEWEVMAMEEKGAKEQVIAKIRALERELETAKYEREALRIERDRESESLANLQNVLEEFQATKESEIQFAVEGLQKQLTTATTALHEYQLRAQAAEV